MADDGTITTSIGRYLVDGLIGEGAMADVYKAYDPEIDRTVAIKVLKDELCVDEEYVNRFLREARAAGALSHPNIVTIYDVGRVGRKPYITMEFLEEQTLSDLLSKNEKLPLKRVVSIGIQLAQALDYAHRLGVVHRDIKPANILFMRHGDSIKVADFGIARVEGGDDMHKTHAGTVLGTPRYMSPEQALGDKLDGRSDLFSVGVILYELFTGAKAFNASTMTSLLLQITQKDPEPIRKTAPDLPVGLQRIVTKLLSKKPEKRFQNGAELAEALSRELSVLIEQEEEAASNKFLPLKVRWALAMGGIIAVVMAASMLTVFHFQGKAIQQESLDAGSSLAKFIATESAIPVLSEDWIRLETFVQDASERDTFTYLIVADHTGTVRAATDQSLVGKPYVRPHDMEVLKIAPDVTASSVDLPNGQSVFNFDTPILFQTKEVGRIYMGLSQEGLEDVMGLTRTLMAALGVITVAAVVLMLYVFGGMLARPMKRLRQAMLAVAAGDLDQRISETRRDEIGALFTAFNRMMEGLASHVASAAPAGDEPQASRPIPAMWRDEETEELNTAGAGDLTLVSSGPSVSAAIEATLISTNPGPAPVVDRNNPFLEEDPFNENEPVRDDDPFADDEEGGAMRSPQGKR
ncbi:MAG: protein kinase [Alphaproteobacteria bacterium]|nr:protein kinase [Alphaproteobacteria bacterium]